MGTDELNARFSAIQASIKAEGLITRRHFDVVAEDLRGHIRLIAEGHEALREQLDGVKQAIERLETGQERLEVGQRALASHRSNQRGQRR